MPILEDVVISLIKIMNKIITQLSPVNRKIKLQSIAALDRSSFLLKPFDQRIIDFLDALSASILSDKRFNRVPEMVALAFWLRKSNLNRIIRENKHLIDNVNYKIIPEGVIFHVCPSNVDTMFIYSLAIALLTGNKNIIKISEKLDYINVGFLFNQINKLLRRKKFKKMGCYLSIITYGHDVEINKYLSINADVRIIWGGDKTAELFKSYAVKPRTKDLVFGDRISCAVFKAESFLSSTDRERAEITRRFYNDSYTFDQKGCSSPQTNFILGNANQYHQFKKIFYGLLQKLADQNYKRDAFSLASLKFEHLAQDALAEAISGYSSKSVNLVFAEAKKNPLDFHSCGGGYFYFKNIDSISDLKKLLNTNVQTVSYYGLDEREISAISNSANGIWVDRVVPIGRALDFDYIWDSYNLVEELTRKMFIKK